MGVMTCVFENQPVYAFTEVIAGEAVFVFVEKVNERSTVHGLLSTVRRVRFIG